MTERRKEGHHCIVVEAVAPPDSHGCLSQGRVDSDGVKVDYYGDAVVLGCDCHGSAAAQVESHDQEWLAELSSERFGTFGGSWFHPHEGSSAQKD